MLDNVYYVKLEEERSCKTTGFDKANRGYVKPELLIKPGSTRNLHRQTDFA